MTNSNKLKGKIVEKGLTIQKVAELIGMDKSSFYRKLNDNAKTFTIKEANAIVSTLSLTMDEAVAIFFAPDVA